MLAFGVAVASAISVASRLTDPDLWWHLRIGQIIWNTHSVPLRDTLSFTAYGHALVPHEWLGELGIYAVYRLGGYSALMAGLTILASLLFVLVYILCYLRSRNALISLAGGLLAWYVGTVGLAIRPLIPGHICLVAELILLEAGSRRREWLWLLPPLFAVWINLHGSWFFGAGVLLLYWACAHIGFEHGPLTCQAWDRKGRKLFSAIVALSAAALFVNPVGLRLVFYPLDEMFRQPGAISSVAEWLPPGLDDGRAIIMIAAAACVAPILLWKRSRISLQDLLLVLAASVLAFRHVRMLLLFGIVAPPVLCRLIAATDDREKRDHPAMNAAFIAAFLAAAVWMFPDRAALQSQIRAGNPVGAVKFIRNAGLHGPMMNDYGFGGYLTWELPEEKVFIDGQTEIFEWTGVLEQYGRWVGLGEDPKLLPDKYGIRLCLLPANAQMRQALRYMPGWRQVYEDKVAAVYAR